MSKTKKTNATKKVGAKGRPRATKSGSKIQAVITLLKQHDGATLAQIMKVTSWQAHSVRGLFPAPSARSSASKSRRARTPKATGDMRCEASDVGRRDVRNGLRRLRMSMMNA